MINQAFTTIQPPFLPMNYYAIRRYDTPSNYLSYTHLSSDLINHAPNQLKQGLMVNYLMHLNSLAQNLAPSITLNTRNTDGTPKKIEEEFNQKDLNIIENKNCCKLEADCDSNAPKSTKKKEPQLKIKSSTHKQKKTEIKKNFWLPAEDALVLDLMKVYGQKWTKISTFLQDRTGKQVRDRYLNHLRPTIDQRDWSDEEDSLLRRLAVELEHRWTVIAAKLNGRTENQVKNRYHALLRRDKREVQEMKILRKLEAKLTNFNEVDHNYEGLVFQPKLESTLTYGSEEDSNKSENEPWDYACQPLKFNTDVKLESTDLTPISDGSHERQHFLACLDQYKNIDNRLVIGPSNYSTKIKLMVNNQEESLSGSPIKKVKFTNNLNLSQAIEVKEESL